MYIHCGSSIVKKHDRECLANWAKENKVVGWEKIYSGNHPVEVAKRQKAGLRQWHERKRKEEKKRYK